MLIVLVAIIACCVLVIASRGRPGEKLIRPGFLIALGVVLVVGVIAALVPVRP